ncbi:MAG: hypothetical protein HKO54_00475 [Flavobacteriaceae bacterium]|nr:hypothetical protein [Flavobacteriaceae bacterium]
MKSFYNFVIGSFYSSFLISISSIVFFILSCKSEVKEIPTEIGVEEKENVIEIITKEMDFQMQDTITSGWNTIRYKNMSPQTHFILVDQYPEGRTSEDAEKYVAPVFDKGMALIMEGKTEEGYAEFSNLPEWFSDVKFVGGTGLLSPGEIGETMLNLKPGNYILECYVKMPNGVFHTSMGMTKDIIVIEEDSGNEPLQADVEIKISSTNGIIFNDSISSGKHIFSVLYEDQIVHENFVGHDISLAKLDENANLEVIERWMNWADPKGLVEPAPAGIRFLGGVNDMPQGGIGYFTANLDPGIYVLISEVPDALKKNMLKTFEVRARND